MSGPKKNALGKSRTVASALMFSADGSVWQRSQRTIVCGRTPTRRARVVLLSSRRFLAMLNLEGLKFTESLCWFARHHDFKIRTAFRRVAAFADTAIITRFTDEDDPFSETHKETALTLEGT